MYLYQKWKNVPLFSEKRSDRWLKHLKSVCVLPDEDKEEYGKGP